MYVYIVSDQMPTYTLYTVGFYDRNGEWKSESDHTDSEKAAERVAWLNGSGKKEDMEEIWRNLSTIISILDKR